MIRKQVSEILEYTIPQDGWDNAFDKLDKDGRITQRKMIQMMLLVLKKLESNENGE